MSPQPRAVGGTEVEELTVTQRHRAEEEGINLMEEEGIVSRVRGSKILAREDSTSCCPKPLQEITVTMSFNSI
jgi:hypothetical protein